MIQAHAKQCWCALLVALLLVLTPTLAFAEGSQEKNDPYDDAVLTSLDDGTYLVDVEMSGGAGHATITSPAKVTVKDGKAVATVVWSSSNYDYMIVNDKTYYTDQVATHESGYSTFIIPVIDLDEPFEVIANTTAMGNPHAINYTLTFKGDTVRSELKTHETAPWVVPTILGIATITVIITVISVKNPRIVRQQRRKAKKEKREREKKKKLEQSKRKRLEQQKQSGKKQQQKRQKQQQKKKQQQQKKALAKTKQRK